jgi:hypothetical protein
MPPLTGDGPVCSPPPLKNSAGCSPPRAACSDTMANPPMEQPQLTWIANFIWGIADDVLRDLYVRGKYRDVILPMTVLRRLDAVLGPTKQADA